MGKGALKVVTATRPSREIEQPQSYSCLAKILEIFFFFPLEHQSPFVVPCAECH